MPFNPPKRPRHNPNRKPAISPAGGGDAQVIIACPAGREHDTGSLLAEPSATQPFGYARPTNKAFPSPLPRALCSGREKHE